MNAIWGKWKFLGGWCLFRQEFRFLWWRQLFVCTERIKPAHSGLEIHESTDCWVRSMKRKHLLSLWDLSHAAGCISVAAQTLFDLQLHSHCPLRHWSHLRLTTLIHPLPIIPHSCADRRLGTASTRGLERLSSLRNAFTCMCMSAHMWIFIIACDVKWLTCPVFWTWRACVNVPLLHVSVCAGVP